MTMTILWEEKDTLFRKIALNNSLFEKDFKLLNDVFSLFEGFKEYIDMGEILNTEREHKIQGWGSFLTDFYEKYHLIRYMFMQVIQGNPLKKNDFEDLFDNARWIVNKIKMTFRESNGVPYARDSLLAGRFYNRMFYSLFSNQREGQSYLNIVDSNPVLVMNTTENEYGENITLTDKLNKAISDDTGITEDELYSKEEQEKIAVMWYRTVDVVTKQLDGILEDIAGEKKVA